MSNYGTVRVKVKELLEESGLSKNKLCHRAELQHTQLNNFCRNEVTRLDTDVLARLCSAFDCKISDLLEYIPPEKKNDAE